MVPENRKPWSLFLIKLQWPSDLKKGLFSVFMRYEKVILGSIGLILLN